MSDPFAPRLPEYIDSSMRSTFVSCPQKYFNQYCRRMATEAVSPDLHAGGAIAAALETVRKGFYRDGLSADEARNLMFTRFMRYWGDYEAPETHNKTFTNTWAALDDTRGPDDRQVGYLAEYPLATDNVQPMRNEDGSPAVEFSFAIPLPINHPDTGNPIMYAGRFDMFGEQAAHNYVVDEKSTGKGFPYNWTEQWDLRGQFLGYVWAGRQSGYDVEGFIVRGIAILKTEIRHIQATKSVSQYMLDRWYQQLLHDVQRLVNMWKNQYFDYNFAESCTQYGICQYATRCTAKTPDVWNADFVERMWNPLLKDPTALEDAA